MLLYVIPYYRILRHGRYIKNMMLPVKRSYKMMNLTSIKIDQQYVFNYILTVQSVRISLFDFDEMTVSSGSEVW